MVSRLKDGLKKRFGSKTRKKHGNTKIVSNSTTFLLFPYSFFRVLDLNILLLFCRERFSRFPILLGFPKESFEIQYMLKHVLRQFARVIF